MTSKVRYPVQKAFRFLNGEAEKINELSKALNITQTALIGKALEALEHQLAQASPMR